MNPTDSALTPTQRLLAEAQRFRELQDKLNSPVASDLVDAYKRLQDQVRGQLKSPVGNELVEAYKKMQEQLQGPFQGLQAEIVAAHAKAVEQLHPIQEALDRLRAVQEAAAVQAFAQLRLDDLYQQLERNWVNSPAARAFDGLQSLLRDVDWEELWKRDSEALAASTREGWFLQPEHQYDVTDRVFEVKDDPQGIEAVFVQTLEPLVAVIIERISKAHPIRQHVLNEGLALYREGRYLAAIPLFLSTADGIAYEVAGQSAFSVKGKKTTLAKWVAEQPGDEERRQYMDYLAEPHPLTSPSGKRKFSRHGVQHGVDVTYGTKANCLRAISFVGFVAWLMSPQAGATEEHPVPDTAVANSSTKAVN